MFRADGTNGDHHYWREKRTMALIIRREQMDAFVNSRMELFVQRMVAHLRSTYPVELREEGLEGPDLEPTVRRGIRDAKQYGVTYESDLRLYLDCMVRLGPHFDVDPEHEWVGAILKAPELDGETKMARIAEHLLFDQESL